MALPSLTGSESMETHSTVHNTERTQINTNETATALNTTHRSSDGSDHSIVTDNQTAVALKAPLASPTFTGTVTIPTPFTIGAVSLTSTATELNYLDGVTVGTAVASKALVVDANKDLTLDGGDLTVSDFTATNAIRSDFQYAETADTAIRIINGTATQASTYIPAGAATATLDVSNSNIQSITMPAGNITIAISNETAGQCFLVEIIQDSGGSRTVTWFSTIKWAGGVAPTLTTTANKKDTFGFRVTGTDTYDGYIVGQNI